MASTTAVRTIVWVVDMDGLSVAAAGSSDQQGEENSSNASKNKSLFIIILRDKNLGKNSRTLVCCFSRKPQTKNLDICLRKYAK
jgi:hypothetical protein